MSDCHLTRIKRSKGVTMVEISLGLAISAIVVASVYTGMKGSLRRNEITVNADLIVEMVTAARASYGQRGIFNQLTTSAAVQSGLIPRQYLRVNLADGEAANSYGGSIELEALNVFNTYAYLRFDAVPADQCMPLVMAVNDAVQGISVTNIDTNAKPTAAEDWNVKPHGEQSKLDVEKLRVACELEPSSNLHFSFNRGSS